MRSRLLLLVLLITGAITLTAEAADVPRIPSNQWEQYSQGIASTMTLTNWKDNGRTKNAITVYIKNTSPTIKSLMIGGPDWVHIYCGSNANQLTPLHSYQVENRASAEGVIQPIPIMPGHVFKHAIELTPDELAKIKSSLVRCEFKIYDPSTNQAYTIQSTPKILISEP